MSTDKNGTHNRGIGDDIIRLRNEGFSYREIQKMLNCSKSTINFHCKKHDKTDTGMNVYPVEQEMQSEIKEYTKGHTKRQAIEKFNKSRSTIKRYKTKNNE